VLKNILIWKQKLQNIDFKNDILPQIDFSIKSQTVTGFLEAPTGKNIWLTASAKMEDNKTLSPELLLSWLTYSHFIELKKVFEKFLIRELNR